MSNTKIKIASIALSAATVLTMAGIFAPATLAVGPFNFTASMMLGSKDASTGGQVSMLQQALKAEGASVYPSGLVTGFFGSLTKSAVMNFQAKYGISQVGLVGPATRAKLNSLYGAGGTGETSSKNAALVALIAQLFPASQQAQVLALLNGLLPANGTTPTASSTPVPGSTTVPTTGNVTVSVAADSPSMPTIPIGAGNEIFTKVNIANGTSANVNLTGIKITRFGNTADNSFAGVKVWDSSQYRHGSTGAFGNNVAQFSFASAPIAIGANSSATIYLVGDISSSVSGGSAGMKINAAADLTFDSNVTVGGTFPAAGHEFTLVSGTNILGSLTLDVVGNNYVSNLNVGSTGNIIGDWKFTAGSNEDTLINKIIFTQRGTIANTDYKNIALVSQVDGSVLGTIASPTSDNKVVFDFSSNPLRLTKGQSVNYWIKADIVSGSNRTIQFSIETSSDVVSWGGSTGAGFLPTAGATTVSYPIGVSGSNFNLHTINQGNVSFTKNINSPSAKIVSGALTDLGLFDVTASGEDIEVQNIYAGIGGVFANSVTSKIVTFGLYDANNNAIASPQTSITPSITTSQYNIFNFGLSPFLVVKAGQTATIKLRVQLDGTAIVNGDTVRAVINGVTFRRISSNNTATNGVTTTGDVAVGSGLNVTNNTLLVDTSALTVAKDTAYGNQTFVTGASQVKVGQWTLTAGPAEGVNITSFTLSTGAGNSFDVAGNAFTNSRLKNVKLFKSDGTQLDVTNAIPSGSITFTPSGFTINAGQSVVVYVTADISSAATGSPLELAGAAAGTGKTSSRSLSDTAKAGQDMTISSTGGTLTLAVDTTSQMPSSIFSPSTTGAMLSKIRFTTNNVEAVKVTRVKLGFVNGAGNAANVYLYDSSGNLIATQSVVSNAVDFQGLNLQIPISSSAVYTVKVDTTPVGTLNNNQWFVDPFVLAEATGLSSGIALKPIAPGTSALASTNWNGGSTTDLATGNLVHISGASSGQTTAGYYIVTTSSDNLSGGANIGLNGTATQQATTDRLTQVSVVQAVQGNSTFTTAPALGAVVYVYDPGTAGCSGFAVVTTGSTTASSNVFSGITACTSVASSANAWIVNVSNANVLGGQTMLAREAKPLIALASGSPSGSTSANTNQVVGIFNITAAGSRDLTITSLKLDKGGSLKGGAYVKTLKVYSGNNGCSGTQIGGVAGTTLTGTGNTTNVVVASTADLRAGATVYLDLGNTGVYSATAVTVSSVTDATHFIASAAVNWTAAGGFVVPTTVTFDSNASTAWVNQTITSGQTGALTVCADTSNVNGVGSDISAGAHQTFSVAIGGSQGPTATNGYVTYQYTTFGGSSFTGKTESDSYPIYGGTLSY